MSIELGKTADYSGVYNPDLLEPFARSLARDLLDQYPSEYGLDIWTAYELSWLSADGLPRVAIAEFFFDPSSDRIVESKSFKYYLNSFNQTVFESTGKLVDCLKSDLSSASGKPVDVKFYELNDSFPIERIPGECLDNLPIKVSEYAPNAGLLRIHAESLQVEKECLYSHLLKSNCPVTGQPDWATVWFCYSGSKVERASLLEYVVSYRDHQGFHENCVEQMYVDFQQKLRPSYLEVYARYTRRGGLDINPYRCSEPLSGLSLPFGRTVRQ